MQQRGNPLWQDRPAAENLEVAVNADRLGFQRAVDR